ncbi:Uncharacterised protein [Mycobacterium tuberculosis]|nr:Uncharacterised protein [Mycobacterium tuberculosis]COY34085.1 Uncharacterised protein [Mycobacterium tuberculosis]COY45901.1 Uncharacterised protein [Mycobacterium tuberculosis]
MRFVRDNGDGCQAFTMPAECVAHQQDSPTRGTMDEQVSGEPQRTQEAFVSDHPSRL